MMTHNKYETTAKNISLSLRYLLRSILFSRSHVMTFLISRWYKYCHHADIDKNIGFANVSRKVLSILSHVLSLTRVKSVNPIFSLCLSLSLHFNFVELLWRHRWEDAFLDFLIIIILLNIFLISTHRMAS